MSGLDVSRLSPDDIVAALRSYPRRFRELLTSVDPNDVPAEAIEHADHVARSLALLGQAMRQVLVHDGPTLMPAVTDDAQREWAHTGTWSIDDALAFLDMEANELAGAVGAVSSQAWTRAGTIAGSGQSISALDVAREAVRTGSDHLRSAERLLSHE